MADNAILVIGRVDAQGKGGGGRTPLLGQGEVDINTLSTNLSAFISSLGTAFNQISTSLPQYDLDEIEVNADISVSGGISLIGTASMETSGGLTLKFKRSRSNG